MIPRGPEGDEVGHVVLRVHPHEVAEGWPQDLLVDGREGIGDGADGDHVGQGRGLGEVLHQPHPVAADEAREAHDGVAPVALGDRSRQQPGAAAPEIAHLAHLHE